MTTKELRQRARFSRTLVLTDGQKGGIGKSTVTRAMVHHLVHSGFQVIGFDGDPTNPHLRRYCSKQITVECAFLEPRTQHTRDPDGWQLIGNAVGTSENGTVMVVDLPAGILGPLESQMPQFRRLCAAHDCRLIRVWVMDGEDDSVRLLKRSKDVIPLRDTVIVMNGRDGHEDSFDIWKNSGIREEHENEHKAAYGKEAKGESYLPFLPVSVRGRIRNAKCSFADAFSLDLSPYDRIDLEMWLEQLEGTFEPLLKLIGAPA